MTYATLSSKGQITVPARFLAALGLKPSDRIEIQQASGELRLRKATDFLGLKGSLKGLKAVDERGTMMKAVAAHVRGRRG